MLTALALALGFIIIGKAILLFVGVEVADFLVAGGIILLVLSVKDLVTGKMMEIKDLSTAQTVGVATLRQATNCRTSSAYYSAPAC